MSETVTQRLEGLVLPERRIPVPQTISPQAQAFLMAPTISRAGEEPPPSDVAAWRAYVAEMGARMAEMAAAMEKAFPTETKAHRLAATDLYEIVPTTIAERNRKRAILFVHGGAFVLGGGRPAGQFAAPLASNSQTRVYSIDYRMPPDHPFPAGLDDALEAYRFILERHDPARVAVMGSSAGGGLAASMLLKARDLGLPSPAAAVLLTPEVDLTESGDSFETNQQLDVVLKTRLSNSIALYANGHDLTDPYLSPVFGDFTKGFPPTLLTSGTRDLFLSNTVLFHRALRRAGIEAELHVFEAMPHAGFGGAPEDAESAAEQIRFIDKHLAAD